MTYTQAELNEIINSLLLNVKDHPQQLQFDIGIFITGVLIGLASVIIFKILSKIL